MTLWERKQTKMQFLLILKSCYLYRTLYPTVKKTLKGLLRVSHLKLCKVQVSFRQDRTDRPSQPCFWLKNWVCFEQECQTDEKEQHMKTSAFEQWCDRHEIPTATRDFLAHLRASPPAHWVQGRLFNVWPIRQPDNGHEHPI
jgi:hypothetical protein